MGGSSRSRMAEANIVTDAVAGIAAKAWPWNRLRRQAARFDPFDVATIILLAAIAAVALWTFRDYAISNDEGVQHHYGELILAYYASGFSDQSVFHFENLYLYGGLFDIVAVALVTPDPDRSLRSAPYPVRADRHCRDRRDSRDRAIGGGSARGPDRGDRARRLRRLVWRDVQPHQGHPLCRGDDGGDVVPRPYRARSAVASPARCRCFRRC